jgi:hypothetical protein
MVPFMCTKLSPCCVTLTCDATSLAISRSSFMIRFVSAIAARAVTRRRVDL